MRRRMNSLSFETVLRERKCGWTDQAGITIRDPKQMEWFWERFTRHYLPSMPEPPEVEFEHEMLIAACRGKFGTGGYHCQITRVYDIRSDRVGRFLGVLVGLHNPKGMTQSESSQPFHIIKLARLEYLVHFAWIRYAGAFRPESIWGNL